MRKPKKNGATLNIITDIVDAPPEIQAQLKGPFRAKADVIERHTANNPFNTRHVDGQSSINSRDAIHVVGGAAGEKCVHNWAEKLRKEDKRDIDDPAITWSRKEILPNKPPNRGILSIC